MISRRDFLKLKANFLLFFYLSKQCGINILCLDKQCVNYKILDELAKLPFSDEIKKEVIFRVNLQKKYGKDANGKLVKLQRFFNEIGTTMIYYRSLYDFRLLQTLNYYEIDTVYYLNYSAMTNNTEILNEISSKFIQYANSNILNEALYYALQSCSFDTTLQLLETNIKLNNKTKDLISKIVHKQEYDKFIDKLSLSKIKLPQNTKNSIFNRKYVKYTFDSVKDSEIDLLNYIVHNSMVDLMQIGLINDFSLKISKYHIHLTTYSLSYSICFLNILENKLYENGFEQNMDYERIIIEIM